MGLWSYFCFGIKYLGWRICTIRLTSWRGNRTIPRQFCVEPYHQLRCKRISGDGRECFLITEICAGKQQSEANVPIHIADHECLSHSLLQG